MWIFQYTLLHGKIYSVLVLNYVEGFAEMAEVEGLRNPVLLTG